MTLRILGIDPGLRITGYGAILCDARGISLLEAGVITPDTAALFNYALQLLVRFGAATETELKEKKHRMEDAVSTARSAVEEGMLPGGGAALVDQVAEPEEEHRVRRLAHPLSDQLDDLVVERIAYLHVKDVDGAVLHTLRRDQLGFDEGIRRRRQAPGDSPGCRRVNVRPRRTPVLGGVVQVPLGGGQGIVGVCARRPRRKPGESPGARRR